VVCNFILKWVIVDRSVRGTFSAIKRLGQACSVHNRRPAVLTGVPSAASVPAIETASITTVLDLTFDGQDRMYVLEMSPVFRAASVSDRFLVFRGILVHAPQTRRPGSGECER
jgi:hypothetical protein